MLPLCERNSVKAADFCTGSAIRAGIRINFCKQAAVKIFCFIKIRLHE